MVEMLDELRDSRAEIEVQNRELQILATRDALTGCLNRRTFFESFERLWTAATRHDTPLACMMLDIDFFKSINDNYGHSTGDEVLRRVAQSIQDACREEDLLCRYGGEEFCMLTPQLDIESCAQAADRIRQLVQSLKFSVPELKVTISLGVSSVVFGAQDPQEMLDQADKSLYVAKRNGRNQVCRWDTLTEEDIQAKEKSAATYQPIRRGRRTGRFLHPLPGRGIDAVRPHIPGPRHGGSQYPRCRAGGGDGTRIDVRTRRLCSGNCRPAA